MLVLSRTCGNYRRSLTFKNDVPCDAKRDSRSAYQVHAIFCCSGQSDADRRDESLRRTRYRLETRAARSSEKKWPDTKKKLPVHLSPSPVKSSALQRIVTFPGAGIEIVSRQSPTFQSGPSSPQLLLITCMKQARQLQPVDIPQSGLMGSR